MVQSSLFSFIRGSEPVSKWQQLKLLEARMEVRVEHIISNVMGYHVGFPYIAASVFSVVFIIVGLEVYVGYLGAKKQAASNRLRELTKLREASLRADSESRPAEAPATLTNTTPWPPGGSSPGLGLVTTPSALSSAGKSRSRGNRGGSAGNGNDNGSACPASSSSSTMVTPTTLTQSPIKSPSSAFGTPTTQQYELKSAYSDVKRGDSGYRMRKVDEFLRQITSVGLGCRRQKVAGTPPPTRHKCLKLRGDGLLYFYSETFKVKRAFYSDDTWDLRELTAALEGDPYLGEVYLEFLNKHSKKHTILRLCIDDTRERRNCIKQFEEITTQMKTHPEWVLKVCRDNVAAVEAAAGGSGGSGSGSPTPNGSPRGTALSPSLSPGEGRGGMQGQLSPPAFPPRAVSVPDGLIDHSPRSPNSCPSTPGIRTTYGAQTILDGVDDDEDTYEGVGVDGHGQNKIYQVSYKTNFHEWMNKELLSLINHEGLDHLIRLHREREDLIRVLETHFRKKYDKPIVAVDHTDFGKQLHRIYRLYNKDKIREIPKMVAHFTGKEHYLLETIIDRYDIADKDLYLFGAER